jgi:penicillin-binding protein 1A
VSLRYALSRSINTPTVKFYLDFGLAPVLETVRSLGITRELPKVPALFLGAGELTLWDVVRAFAPMGNQGVYVEPYLVSRIENTEGVVLEEAHIQQREALDPATAYLMSNLLTSTLVEGTGARARQYGFGGTGAGKTGTTNDFTDAWFVGFTPELCAGVWVGFDEKVTMGPRKTGAVMALPIWADFMGKIAAQGPDEPFPRPAGVVARAICARTGLLATTRCDSVRTEVFLAGNCPTRGCDLHHGRILEPRDLREETPAAAATDVEEGL